MDTRLDQYSSKQRSYKDFLREQGQQQIKELPSIPDAQPLIQPAPQEPQQPQYTEDDLQRALQVLQGGDYSGPLSPGTQYSGQAPITQPFGNRSSVERFSNGINYGTDFGVPVGTQVNLPQGQWKVLSTYNGAKAGYVGDGEDSGYGNSVYVQNMQTGEKLRLSHLSQVNVKTGQVVPGGVIGLSGATGNVTGPHLDAEYYTPNGQIADIARTPYANSLFGQTQGKTKGKGGGNPFMDMLRNVGNTALGELDPANESVPILGPIRTMNRKLFGQQPYADPNLPWDQRIANAIQQYGNSYMGAHGDFGGVGAKGGLMDVALSHDTQVKPPSILREGQDPIGFNSQYPYTVARERFNIPQLVENGKLGAGSDRDVYDLGNGQVLKIAKQARGLSQNDSEGDMYAPVPEVIEKGKNYVVAQKVNPPDEQTKMFVKAIEDARNSNIGHRSNILSNLQAKYSNEGNDDLSNILSDLMNYDPMMGDLARIKNWGTDSNGLPILLDGGALNESTLRDYEGTTNMSNPDFRDAVMQSRAAKKQFGDTDKNTMYSLLPILAALGLAGASQKKGETQQQQ